MRLLFYTAIAVLITLAGVFAFYALRSGDTGAGVKVVLSIDPNQMPGADDGSKDKAERASINEADARLKPESAPGEEPKPADAAPAKQFDMKVSEAPAAAANEPAAEPERSQDTPTGSSDRLAAVSPPPPASEESQDDLPALPGTATGNFRGGDAPRPKALSQEAAPATSQDRVAVQAIETIPAQPRAAAGSDPTLGSQRDGGALRETLLPGRDRTGATASDARVAVAQPEPAPSPAERNAAGSSTGAVNGEQEGKANMDAILAALNQQNEAPQQPSPAPAPAIAAAPPAAPPPLPLKRPAGVEPPTRTAALNGWAPTKFTTTEVATPKAVRIAILLRGVGRDDNTSSEAVTKLPSAISLAFMPYNGGAQQWATKARELGHEVIVQLPLEPSDYPINNPGPETLLSSSAADENLSRMKTVLGRFDGYTGVTNFLGGKILQSKTALRPILENLKSQGLIYVGEGNGSHAIVKGLAAELGLRYGNADVIIDAQPSPAAIKKALERLVALARKDGTAIGLGYASRPTMEQVRAWSETLAAEGVTLVPVGALAQTPGAS
jgi:polysaccharide deacetylase 2 family uncharacterized protein YibQ